MLVVILSALKSSALLLLISYHLNQVKSSGEPLTVVLQPSRLTVHSSIDSTDNPELFEDRDDELVIASQM